jgi:hypothetical protein
MFNKQKNKIILLFVLLCGIINMLYQIQYYKINNNNFIINEIIIMYFNVLSNIFTGSIFGILFVNTIETFFTKK